MKKKILFWISSFDKGGTEKVTLDLVNNLDSDKYEITVMQKFKGGYYKSLLKPHIKKKCCFPLFANGIARIFRVLPGKVLYRMYIKEKYDVEIAVGDGEPCKFIGGSFNDKSKKIAWIHMDVLKEGGIMPEFETKEGRYKFYEPFDNIVCVSEDCKNSFVEKFGFSDKCIVKYNAIPEKDIINKSNEALDIKINKDIINIVTVGRLVEQKGYDRLLKVHKILMNEGFNYNLYIIGEGKEKEKLEKYINDNNLNGSVKLLGFKENPYKYINMADLFISSSRNEAFSTVQSEAIILGTPVLTTKCAGTTELLGKNEYGIIVNNDIEGLYSGLKDILEDKNLLKKYKNAAQKRAEFFKLENNIKSWEELLD